MLTFAIDRAVAFYRKYGFVTDLSMVTRESDCKVVFNGAGRNNYKRRHDPLMRHQRDRDNSRIHMVKHMPIPACDTLFYPGCGQKNPNIKDVFQILFAEDPALARYALIYLAMMKDILRLDSTGMEAMVTAF